MMVENNIRNSCDHCRISRCKPYGHFGLSQTSVAKGKKVKMMWPQGIFPKLITINTHKRHQQACIDYINSFFPASPVFAKTTLRHFPYRIYRIFLT